MSSMLLYYCMDHSSFLLCLFLIPHTNSCIFTTATHFLVIILNIKLSVILPPKKGFIWEWQTIVIWVKQATEKPQENPENKGEECSFLEEREKLGGLT